MFVKYVLNLQLQQFFFHAGIFVVRLFLHYLSIFLPPFLAISFGYILIWLNYNLLFAFAVCKSCSLACSECPICRTNISDRLFAFTSWLFKKRSFAIFYTYEPYSVQVQIYNMFSFFGCWKFPGFYLIELIYPCGHRCNSFIVCKTV